MKDNYVFIPGALTALLRQMVYSQDAGYPLFEALQTARFPSQLVDAITKAVDIERLRMRNEGLPVYVRADNTPLVIGLDDKPFKAPHQCFQHEAQYGEIESPNIPGLMVQIAACRFCGTSMPLPMQIPDDDFSDEDDYSEDLDDDLDRDAEESSEAPK